MYFEGGFMKHFLLLIFSLFMPVVCQAADHTQLFNKISIMAEKGDGEAAYHLGMLYNNGIAVQRNIKEAYRWFSISAAENDPLGAYKLGCYFGGQAGDVVEYSQEKSLQYKLFSANAGYALAQYDVGLAYLKMNEVEKADAFLTLAAQQGFVAAFRVLGYLNYQGALLERNMVKAYFFTALTKAMSSDEKSPKILALLETMEAKMTKAEILLSKKNIREWKIVKTPLTIKAQAGLTRSYEHAGLSLMGN